MLYDFISEEVCAANTIQPNYRTEIAGKSVKFHCEVIFTKVHVMTWYFESQQIYYYYEGVARYPAGKTKYSVKQSEYHHFILEVKNLTIKDGGTYECSALENSANAYLLVLGKFKVILSLNLFMIFL